MSKANKPQRARRPAPQQKNRTWFSRDPKTQAKGRKRRWRRAFRKPLVEQLEDRRLLAFNALNLDANNELVSLGISRGSLDLVYEASELIGIDVTAFDGVSTSVVIVGSGEGVPSAGQRATLLEDNAFDTGVINPDRGPAEAKVTFDAPIINSAGADVVLFEIEPAGGSDVIQLQINGVSLSRTISGPNLATGNVPYDLHASTGGIPNTLADLESFGFGGPAPGGQAIHGLEIDLSDFGVPVGGSVTSMEFGAAPSGDTVDPVFIAGLPEVRFEVADGLTVNYDAGIDSDFGDDRWENTVEGINPNFDWNVPGSTFNPSPTTSYPGITGAYSFNGDTGGNEFVGQASGSFDAFNNLPGGPDNEDASWEIWFKPDSVANNGAADYVLWETGNNGDGASFAILNGNTLRFTIDDGGVVGRLNADISGLGGEFIQAVATYNRDSSGDLDVVHLYINGDPTPVASFSNNNLEDWDNGDDASIGRRGSTTGGDAGGADDLNFNNGFEGEIAILRMYSSGADSGVGTVLTPLQVQGNFLAVANPNPLQIDNLNRDAAVTTATPSNPTILDVGQDTLVTDPDDPDSPASYDGATLTIRTLGGGEAGDAVVPGFVTASNVRVGSTGGPIVGTFNVPGGTDGSPLVITFNATATLANISQVMQEITFSNGVVGGPNNPSRQFEWALDDGLGGLSTVNTAMVVDVGAGVADTHVWEGDVGGDPANWNNSGNWSTNSVPDSNDIAIFDETATTTTVDLSSANAFSGIVGFQTVGTVQLEAGGFSFENGTLEAVLIKQESTDFPQSVLDDDPLIYWRLGEPNKAAGQTAVNSASGPSSLGTAGDGTFFNTVGDVTDTQITDDTGASFGTTNASSTTGDRVQVALTNAFPTTAITAEAWVRGTNAGTSAIFSYAQQGGSNNEFLVFDGGSTIVVYIDNPGMNTGVPDTAVLDGDWHHLAVSWESSTGNLKTYVDGALLSTVTHKQGASIGATGTFVIAQESDSPGGGFQDTQKLVGDLDEVAIFDRVLNATEIMEHASSLAPNENEISAQLQGGVLDIEMNTGGGFGGTLTLSNTANLLFGSNDININAGATVVAAVNGGGFALGNADVHLDDGELELAGGVNTTPDELRHYGFHSRLELVNQNLNDNGGMFNGGRPQDFMFYNNDIAFTNGPDGQGLDYDNDTEFEPAVGVSRDDNYSNLWVGYLTVAPGNAGTWQFDLGRTDNFTSIWLDLDQDGVFESRTGQVTNTGGGNNQNGELLAYEDGTTKSVTLAAGTYLFAAAHTEATGGSNVDVSVRGPNMTGLQDVSTTQAQQAGYWSFGTDPFSGTISNGTIASLNNDFMVDGDSTVLLTDVASVEFSDLDLAASAELNVDSNVNGKLAFRGDSTGVVFNGNGDFLPNPSDTMLNTLNGTTLSLSNVVDTGNGGNPADVQVNPSGNGRVLLPSDNLQNFGSWFVQDGTLELQADKALGEFPYPGVYGGTLLLNNVDLPVNFASQVNLLGGSLTSLGNSSLPRINIEADTDVINLGSTLTIGEINTVDDNPITFLPGTTDGYAVTFDGLGNTTVTSTIGDINDAGFVNGSVVKDGSGTVRLEGHNNYAGLTTINSSVLVAAHDNALGEPGVLGSGHETVVNGAELRLENDITITGEDVDLGSTFSNLGDNTWTGDISLSDDSVIDNDGGTLTIDGDIILNGFTLDIDAIAGSTVIINGNIDTGTGGPATVNHIGNGTTEINSDNSATFTGALDISNGVVVVHQEGALGDASGGTTVSGDGTLQLDGAFNLSAEPISIAGDGEGGVGALLNTGGDTTIGAGVPLTIAASAEIAADAGTLLTIETDIDLGISTLTLDGAGDIDVTGKITDFFGGGGFVPGFYEVNGVIVGEAEEYSSRTAGGDQWLEVPTEDPGSGSASNVRGTFMQVLEDGGGPNFAAGGAFATRKATVEDPNNAALDFDVTILTPGTYSLWSRMGGPDGGGDSMYASIVELKDNVSGGSADWFRYLTGTNMNFGSEPWEDDGELESTDFSGEGNEVEWTITQADINANGGQFTLRYTYREDGTALDAWVLQRNGVGAAPSGFGPASTLLSDPSDLVGIRKSGTGTATLSGDNMYIGQTLVNDGTLVADNPNSLGTATDSQGTTVNGGSLGLDNTAGMTIDEVFTVGGTLQNISGDNTITSDITAIKPAVGSRNITIVSDADTLTIEGNIDLQAGKLIFDGAGDTLVKGDISGLGAGASMPIAGLQHYGYHINNDNFALNLHNNGGLMGGGDPTQGPSFNAQVLFTDGPDGAGLDYDNDTEFINSGAIAQSNNYSNLWLGVLNVEEGNGGNWQFDIGRSDDRAGIWLDLNQNGIFESNDGLLPGNTGGSNNQNGEMIAYEDGTTKTVNLAPGQYLFAGLHREGGGGSNIDISVRGPNMTGLQDVSSTSGQQAGYWEAGMPVDNSLMKMGAGTVTLAGDNSYDGLTTVMAGTLAAASDTALGATVAGTTVAEGATLALDNTNIDPGDTSGNVELPAAESLLLTPSSTGNPPTVNNLAGNNTVEMDVVAETQVPGEIQIISSTAGDVLTINGDIALEQTKLTVDGDGDTVVNGVILGGADIIEPTFADAVIASDPILFWRLGEANKANGETAINAATGAASLNVAGDGTYLGAVGDVVDTQIPNDTAGNFGVTNSGGTTGDRVQVALTNDWPTTTITAEAWVRGQAGATSEPTLFSFEGSNEFILIEQGGTWRIFIDGTATNTGVAENVILDGDWHHVVVTWQSAGGQARLFVDGVPQSSNVVKNGGAMTPTGTLVVAQEQDGAGNGLSNTQKFVGDMDEVAVYNKVLSDAEILDHYNKRNGIGTIPADNSLMKMGSGTLRLTADNTYEDATTVMEGTLDVDGSIVSNTTVQDGATLTGGSGPSAGLVDATVTVEGIGIVHPDGNLTLGDGTAGAFVSDGKIIVDAGDTLLIDDTAVVQLGPFNIINGTLNVTSGAVKIPDGANLSGTGTVDANIFSAGYEVGQVWDRSVDFNDGAGDEADTQNDSIGNNVWSYHSVPNSLASPVMQIAGTDFSTSATFTGGTGQADLDNSTIDDLNLADNITVSNWSSAGGGGFQGWDSNAQAGMPLGAGTSPVVTKIDGDGTGQPAVGTPPAASLNSVSFDLVIPATDTLNLDSVTWDWRKATTGGNVRWLAFKTSLDTNLIFSEVGQARNNVQNANIDLSSPTYQNLTNQTVTFTWYAGGEGSGDIDIDTIIINGSIGSAGGPWYEGARTDLTYDSGDGEWEVTNPDTLLIDQTTLRQDDDPANFGDTPVVVWTNPVGAVATVDIAGTLDFTWGDAPAYSETVITSDPLLYWRLGESNKAVGQTAVNAATGPNSLGTVGDGTYRNAVGDVADTLVPNDTAGNFGTTTAGGTNGDRVELSINNDFPTSAITAETWVRGTSTATQPLFSYASTDGNNNDFLVFLTGGNWNVFINGANASTGVAGGQVLDGQWHHVAVTWDSTSDVARFYVDGTQEGSVTIAQGPIRAGAAAGFVIGQEQDVVLGTFDNNQKFIGDMDEVALYDRVLSTSEIQAHYDAATGAGPNIRDIDYAVAVYDVSADSWTSLETGVVNHPNPGSPSNPETVMVTLSNPALTGVSLDAGDQIVISHRGQGAAIANHSQTMADDITITLASIGAGGGFTISPGDDLGGDMTGDGTDNTGEIGTLSTGSVAFNSASALDIDFTSGGHDQLNVTGSVNLNDAELILDGAGVPSPVPTGGFVIVNNDGSDPVNGLFTDSLGNPIPDGQSVTVAGTPLELRYNYNGGNDVVLIKDPDPIIDTDPLGDDIHDDIIVRLNPTNSALLQVLVDNVNAPDLTVMGIPLGYELVLEATYANLLSLTINANQGSDRLTVDFGNGSSGGNPIPINLSPSPTSNGLIYDGGEGGENDPAGAGAANPHMINLGDRLRVLGIDPAATFQTETYWLGTTDITGDPDRDDAEAGTIVLSGTQTAQITYDNIGDGANDPFAGAPEAILDDYVVNNLKVVGNGLNNILTLTDPNPSGSDGGASRVRGGTDLGGVAGVLDGSDTVFPNIDFTNKFASFNLMGMGGDDTLEIKASEAVGVTADGGPGTDRLVVSTLTTTATSGVTVQLTGQGGTDGWAGKYADSGSGAGTPATRLQEGLFTNIDNLVYNDGNNGTNKHNRIVAPSGMGRATTYRIGTDGSPVTNRGHVRLSSFNLMTALPAAGYATFSGFENLDGGDQPDRFEVRDGGSLSGTINGDNDDNDFDGNATMAELGDPGVDTLDYTGYSSEVHVNLTNAAYTDPVSGTIMVAPNSATAIFGGMAGGILERGIDSSIENVFGGNADDVIRGDTDNNNLGDGPGSDTLDGNAGDDFFSLTPGGLLGGEDPSADHLLDISGQDTVDFSKMTGMPGNGYGAGTLGGIGVMIDMDLVSPDGSLGQDVLGDDVSETTQDVHLWSNGTNLPSPFENINGSPFRDMIWIEAQALGGDDTDTMMAGIQQNGPPVARNVDGGLPVPGDDNAAAGDVLLYNAAGQPVKDTGASVTTLGVGAVTYRSVVLKAYNQAAQVVDNGEVGFEAFGKFNAVDCFGSGISCETATSLRARSLGGDLIFAPKAPAGSGATATAAWTIDGLTPGREYVISMAWPQNDSLATNAPVTIQDGTVVLAQLSLDQNAGPDDYRADGVNWEILGRYVIHSGSAVVRIANNGNGQIFADAVRVEEINTQPLAANMNAELRVLVDDDRELRDGQDTVSLSGSLGGPVTKTVTIANIGTDPLEIYGVTLGDGTQDNARYTLGGATGAGTVLSATTGDPAVIDPGLSRTFTVTLDAASVGDKVDTIIIHSNDMDENVAQKPVPGGTANLAPDQSGMDVDAFTFALSGRVGNTLIIDDEDPGYTSGGFTEFGVDVGKLPQGYHGDLEYSAKGNGSDKAFWEFKNLVAGGKYRVSATWYAYSNRASNAPFTVLDGNRFTDEVFANGNISVDQRVAPNDFVDVGVSWEDLGGSYTVTGSTLTVRLTDQADGYVIADAVRLELLQDDPDIEVLELGSDLAFGGTGPASDTPLADDLAGPVVDFGTLFPNQAVAVRRFRVTNNSDTSQRVALGDHLSLPTGFSLVPGSTSVNGSTDATLFDGQSSTAPIMLEDGEYAEFSVQMVGSSPGTLGGAVSFSMDDDVAGDPNTQPNPDPDENPFEFAVQGQVSSQRIIDNGTPTTSPERTHSSDSYTETGTWSGPDGDGYLDDDRYVNSSSTSAATAVWQFNDLPAGQYEVFVTYSEEPIQGGAKAAPFEVFDGPTMTGTGLATVTVDQTQAPQGVHADGVNWTQLNGAFGITSAGVDNGVLSVRLSNPSSANGFVHADGVMIRRLEGPEIAVFDLGDDGLAGGVGADADVELKSGDAINFGDGIALGASYGLGVDGPDADSLPDAAGPGEILRAFEIRNLGNRTLGLGDPALAFLDRFSVPVPNGGDFTAVAPGGSLGFTLSLDTSDPGIFSEQLSFTTDDLDESNFNLALEAAVGSSIIDDVVGSPQFTTTGTWLRDLGKGFFSEILYNQNVGGAVETASWHFTGVTPGRYRVLATWVKQTNLATNAPYTISGDATAPAPFSLSPQINQKAGPNDLRIVDFNWEQLSIVDVTGAGNVTVTLSSAGANNFVFADAMLLFPVSGPEIVVTDLGADESLGGLGVNADVVLSGSETLTFAGTGATRTLQISNVGFGPLTLSNPSLPADFSITGADPFENTVAQDGMETFQIEFTGTAPGTVGGQVSIGNDDANDDPFTFQVRGTVAEPVTIIDNKDAGFSQTGFTEFGRFTNQVPQGYKDTLHYSQGGGGGDRATWTFTGLTAGIYQVATTWYPDSNRATDAPFSLYDGTAVGTPDAVIRINQQRAPNDFTDVGVGWENLGGIQVTGSTLTVRLTDAIGNANKYVIADAVRIEPVTTPEIEVAWVGPDGNPDTGDELVINDGGSFDFGATGLNVPVERQFQVRNTGGGTLDLSNLIANGAFAVSTDFSDTMLTHGEASATFTVQYAATSEGTATGQVTFDNNDSDENPFNFTARGSVNQGGVVVIDNGNAGWTGQGFTRFVPQGYADDSDGIHDIHYSQVGKGKTATWQFTNLVSGTYRVSTTWYAHSNRATASPFTVHDQSGSLLTTNINQQLAPNDFGDLGTMWEDITGGVVITGDTLKVTLSDNAPGQSGTKYVMADAVRIEKLENAPEIEVRDGTLATDPNVQSGTTINLGSVAEGSTATRDLLIRNVGSAVLTIDPPTGANGITIVSDELNGMPGVPAFTLSSDPDPINGNGEIMAGASSSFQVLFDAAAAGTYNATVTILSDDVDEGSFTIELTATASDIVIIDNGDAGFVAPQFTRFGPPANPAQGFQSDLHHHFPAGGPNKASWTFNNLPDGMYQVAVTWTPHSNRASNAPFRVFDGAVLETQANINQRVAPAASVMVGTTKFQQLGTLLNISGGTIVVELGTSTTGYVIADAVRIERLGPLHAGVAESDGTEFLQETDVSLVLNDAIAAWTAVDPSAAARLAGVDVRVEDLPGSVLGLASEYQNRIWLDTNAAGHGWDVSRESRVESREFDLLTVVTHELGHVLGLPDLDPASHSADVMTGVLNQGVRRLPSDSQFERVRSDAAVHTSPTVADRMFSDLGYFDLDDRLDRTSRTTEDEPIEQLHRSLGETAPHRLLTLDEVSRFGDDDDLEDISQRRDDRDEESADHLFADLFDELFLDEESAYQGKAGNRAT